MDWGLGVHPSYPGWERLFYAAAKSAPDTLELLIWFRLCNGAFLSDLQELA
jgi:hypothetical protein